MRRTARFVLAALPALCMPAQAENLPVGFTDTLVTTIGLPTALAFTPDGRLLIATQDATLRVYQAGLLLPVPALALPTTGSSARVCAFFDSGLLGLAVDPAYPENNFVYLYFTRPDPSPGDCATSPKVNRLSRFVLTPDNRIDTGSEVVLLDGIPSPFGNHNGGDLAFGKDGYLYVTVGDGTCDYAGGGCYGENDAARDRHTLLGKILRIDRAGAVPPDNPFMGAGTTRCQFGNAAPGQVCQETFAWGFRHPFRFAFDPNARGTRFFVNDVGQSAWEEIDLAQAGADYGWNCREGSHPNSTTGTCDPTPTGLVNPLFEYAHGVAIPGTSSGTGCNAITGGAFVPDGVWPAAFTGGYLFSDYTCGAIFRLTDGAAHDFVSGLGAFSAVHLVFGPAGATRALYYTSYASGGSVRRIEFTGARRRPPVDFDGNGVSDVVVYRNGAWLTFAAP